MFFKSISQIDIHYRNSILSYGGTMDGNFLRDAPKSGDRFPYVEFFDKESKTDNYKILNYVCFNLVVLANVLPDEIKKTGEKYNIEVALIKYLPETKKLYKQLGITNMGYYLVRPDMYIVLRSATLNTNQLNNYLQQFLMAHQ